MRTFKQVCEIQGAVWFDDRIDGEQVKASKVFVLEGFDAKNGRSVGQRTVEYPVPMDVCKRIVASGVACPFKAECVFEVQAAGRGSRMVIAELTPVAASAPARAAA